MGNAESSGFETPNQSFDGSSTGPHGNFVYGRESEHSSLPPVAPNNKSSTFARRTAELRNKTTQKTAELRTKTAQQTASIRHKTAQQAQHLSSRVSNTRAAQQIKGRFDQMKQSTSYRGKVSSLDSEVHDWDERWEEDDDEEEENHHQVKTTGGGHRIFRNSLDSAHSSQVVQNQQVSQHRKKDSDSDLVIDDELAKRTIEAFDTTEWDIGQEEKPHLDMFLPMLRVLGRGSFGKVVLVRKSKGADNVNKLFAMKILKKADLVARKQVERTKTERIVLAKACSSHPFLMKLHYAFQTEKKLYFVLDYCPGGELFFHLSRCKRFPERAAKFYAAELVLAIGHLHSMGIIYRDLKPENVLLDAEGHVKLGDFGLTKLDIRHPYKGATTQCGTPEYMAPEVLANVGYGFCVDYWGLGMLIFEMMTGLPPWYTTDRKMIFWRLQNEPLQIPSFFSGEADSLVSGLLNRKPRYRLGVQGVRQVMAHPFFSNHLNWQELHHRRIIPPIRPCESWKDSLTEISIHGGTKNQVDDHLNRAVSNFDKQFTRQKAETVDGGTEEEKKSSVNGWRNQSSGQGDPNGLFPGFTFDGFLDKEQQEEYRRYIERNHDAGRVRQAPSHSQRYDRSS